MAYCHTSHNLHLIADAAKLDDVDAALLSVMKPNGITAGDIAGIMFSGFDWELAPRVEREYILREWLQFELQNG